MPTKRLPETASIEHLKYQAKDLRKAHRARDIQALQRIREFHPRFARTRDDAIAEAPFTLSDAQLAIAREYGFASWPRLRAFIAAPNRDDLGLPMHERIHDPVFRKAVDLLDFGAAVELRAHLAQHPEIARRRVTFEGGNYFRNPTLLEFIAENPARRDALAPNIVEIAQIVLDAGAKDDRDALNSALDLVASSLVARQSGHQRALIDLLCRYGADPDAALRSPLLRGEFAAAQALIEWGARIDLAVAAATGRIDEARRELPGADDDTRQLALALAAQHGHLDIVRLLLDAGADPDRYSPGHSHATPLHQAALAGHESIVHLFVERGARLDIRDVLFQGTPENWATHNGHTKIAAYLKTAAAANTTSEKTHIEN